MAEPVKRAGRFRHSIMVNRRRMTGTFDTKREAKLWEAEMRLAAKRGELPDTGTGPKHKLSDAIDRYLLSVTPSKKNAPIKWDTARFNEFLSSFPGRDIGSITKSEISLWRDEMLKRVSGSTVNRYWNLYSNLFNVARKEWGWVSSNPFSDVRRPKENPPRTAIWRWRNIRRILREGQKRGGKYHEVTQALRISLHTGMRLKEALAAPGGFVRESRVVVITDRKESHHNIPEKIPLTSRGYRVMCQSPQSFKVQANEASTLFSKLCKQIGIKGMQYKDARATALTLMARRMPVEVLQRISRHRDINILINVYYRESAEEIAKRL